MIRSSSNRVRYRERRDLRGTGPLDAPSYVVFLSPLAPYIILLASPANCFPRRNSYLGKGRVLPFGTA